MNDCVSAASRSSASSLTVTPHGVLALRHEHEHLFGGSLNTGCPQGRSSYASGQRERVPPDRRPRTRRPSRPHVLVGGSGCHAVTSATAETAITRSPSRRPCARSQSQRTAPVRRADAELDRSTPARRRAARGAPRTAARSSSSTAGCEHPLVGAGARRASARCRCRRWCARRRRRPARARRRARRPPSSSAAMRGSRAISRTTRNTGRAASSAPAAGGRRRPRPRSCGRRRRARAGACRRRTGRPPRTRAPGALARRLERAEDGGAEVDAGRQRLARAAAAASVGSANRIATRPALDLEHGETGVGAAEQPVQALLALRRDPLGRQRAAASSSVTRRCSVTSMRDRVGDDRAVRRVAGLRAVGQPPDGAVAGDDAVDDLHRVVGAQGRSRRPGRCRRSSGCSAPYQTSSKKSRSSSSAAGRPEQARVARALPDGVPPAVDAELGPVQHLVDGVARRAPGRRARRTAPARPPAPR